MDKQLTAKHQKLTAEMKQHPRIAIAFSGGVDSTLLLHLACNAIGARNVTAITVISAFYPSWELTNARGICESLNIQHKLIDLDPLALSEIASNPPERCYTCKKTGFTLLKEYASSIHISYICDGSCIDDLNDYRPGYQAIQELEISSPFIEYDLDKLDIRELSRELGISGWDRPSCACLASRIPYNQPITLKKLHLVEEAEKFLHQYGVHEARVRLHDNIARIEVFEDNIRNIIEHKDEISLKLRELGATYVSLELAGYKTGSMNRSLLPEGNNDSE